MIVLHSRRSCTRRRIPKLKERERGRGRSQPFYKLRQEERGVKVAARCSRWGCEQEQTRGMGTSLLEEEQGYEEGSEGELDGRVSRLELSSTVWASTSLACPLFPFEQTSSQIYGKHSIMVPGAWKGFPVVHPCLFLLPSFPPRRSTRLPFGTPLSQTFAEQKKDRDDSRPEKVYSIVLSHLLSSPPASACNGLVDSPTPHQSSPIPSPSSSPSPSAIPYQPVPPAKAPIGSPLWTG